ASASMTLGEPSKELFIKKLTAALGYVSLVNNNRVTISFFADGIKGQLANMRGRNYLHKMAEYLLTTDCEGLSHFDNACRQLAAGRIGSGVMIVLSDFLFKEGYDSGLRRLIGRQYDLYAIQVLSAQELSPRFTGDLKLLDIEDADAAEITVSSALLKYYKRNLTAYCNELKDFCRHRGAVYVLANSADSSTTLPAVTSRTESFLGGDKMAHAASSQGKESGWDPASREPCNCLTSSIPASACDKEKFTATLPGWAVSEPLSVFR
ncbi:unnamed protein product, partial [marine sediment metagenome]